jgi:hypothetical protein
MANPNESKLHPADLNLVLLNRQALFEARSNDDSEMLHDALMALHRLNQSSNLPCEDDDCPICEVVAWREEQRLAAIAKREARRNSRSLIRRSLYRAA